MSMDFAALAAPFDPAAIHWRAQTLTKSGDKALALAYLDARDVMNRLDEVCGPANWQDKYEETAKGRVVCSIGIRVGDDWIWKADGAGDTAVEGEKGGISDAFKRAAVKWGIGRYLYALDAVWCPCESYERNGKPHWRRWTANPWDHVRNKPKTPQKAPDPQERFDRMDAALKGAQTLQELHRLWGSKNFANAYKALSKQMQSDLDVTYNGMQEDLA